MVLVPDNTTTTQDLPPAVAALVNTGAKFLIGLAERGPVAGQLDPIDDALHSYQDWAQRHGTVANYNSLEAQCVRRHFDEGGSVLYFGRFVGPAATAATGTATQFTIRAKGPGGSYASVKVGVASGVATVKDGSTVVETSPPLATVGDLQSWASAFSNLVDITPSVAATTALADQADASLSGGSPTDDRINVGDTQRQAALDRFGAGLGPGQVATAGDSRTQMHVMLANHAVLRDRIALCDAPDTATASTITTLAAAIRALGTQVARRCYLLADWLTVPGDAPGTQTLVPPSAIFSGLCARIDAMGNPNRSVAGPAAVSRTATGVHYTRSDADLQAFADAGVVPFRVEGGQVMPYDDITPVDSSKDPQWWEGSTNRFWMRVGWDVRAIGKAFQWQANTGKVDYAGYQGAVTTYLSTWVEKALYTDDTNPVPFTVDTGPNVNTSGPNGTINQKKLRVALGMIVAPNVRNTEAIMTNATVGTVL